MNIVLSPGQQRALAVLILLGLVAAVFGFLVVPVWSLYAHYDDTLETMQDRLVRFRRAAAVEQDLNARHEALKRWQAADSSLLKSETRALAGAELQRIAKRAIQPGGGQVLSTQALPVVEEQGAARVGIRIRMRSDLEAAVKIFYNLETGQPFLFIDNVSTRKSVRRVRRTRKRKPNVAADRLDLDFELFGYIHEGAR